MSVDVKICGISTPAAMSAAVTGGAAFVGLVFYPPSPRSVTPEQAAPLAALVPEGIVKTGLLVDADDATIAAILKEVPLDLLQLHGSETPERAAAIKARFGVRVMKVLKLHQESDLAAVEPYLGVVDRLLFDAKPPAEMKNTLPGGNALSFDWSILAGKTWPLPWMLAGGLTADNLAEAVAVTGAPALDISSGVEDAPGRKNPEKIRAFLAAAKAL
ncbi:phosphoribosylanthranilate isomerase [Pelagibius litoralis]|uniref:N-(5'-phosphoribosyl)anthranilate isomerase n=1 Tax=Pelagibius litoralis TaxID=374515 RepID=A0A967C3T9_9PROT|nr:phosphoribosylanthranilate isomerase [Pelagibius litoralis]NIA67989.1 phosphoribosylanthranilate isomerase [Pelagibius litoralis]